MTHEGESPPPYGAPPPYPPPGYGYGYPPSPPPGWPGAGYGYAPYGYPGYYGDGPPGRIRPTGTSILLFFCTLGIYSFFYNYSVHDEMRRHSNRGIGGGVALLLTFVANIAMPFVTPAEVGSLYSRRGQPPPVNGWTGLWSVIPMVVGYVVQFFVLFATAFAVSSTNETNDIPGALILSFLVWIGLTIAGGVLWFRKTNNALNAYWQSLGVTEAGAHL